MIWIFMAKSRVIAKFQRFKKPQTMIKKPFMSLYRNRLPACFFSLLYHRNFFRHVISWPPCYVYQTNIEIITAFQIFSNNFLPTGYWYVFIFSLKLYTRDEWFYFFVRANIPLVSCSLVSLSLVNNIIWFFCHDFWPK